MWCDKRYPYHREEDRCFLAYEVTERDPDKYAQRIELLYLNMKVKELQAQIIVNAAEVRRRHRAKRLKESVL